MDMRPLLVISLVLLGVGSPARAGIVEEETWYSPEGKVLKTVKRTLTRADARRESDWEPAWIVRESTRSYAGAALRGTRGWSRGWSRSYYAGGWGYGIGFRVGHYPRYRHHYAVPYRYAGRYRSGGAGWRVGYRSSRLAIRYCH